MSDLYQPSTQNPGTFFGRQTQIAWIIDRLAGDQPVMVIYGPDRIGKSTLLRALRHRLPGEYLPVYLDLPPSGDEHTTSPLLHAAAELERAVHTHTEIHIEPPDAARFSGNPHQAWQVYVNTLDAQLGHRQLVLLIDDAARIPAEWLHPLTTSGLPAILTASDRQQLQPLLPEIIPSAPSITLGALDNESAEEMVKQSLLAKSQVDPWATRRILEITSNHPYYIQVFCSALADCCALRAHIMPSDVEETLERLLDRPLPVFQDLWKNAPPREQTILAIFSALRGQGGIATHYDLEKAHERHGTPTSLPDIVAVLERLVHKGILEKLGTNSYRFVLELFRLWVQTHHPPDQVLKRRFWPAEPRRQLTAKLTRLWSLWASLGVVALVFLIVILQPAFKRAGAKPTATPTSGPRQATPTTASTQTQTGDLTATPSAQPTAVWGEYDIVFMSRQDADAPWQLYALNSDSGERLRLTHTETNERTPKWSPDGKRILFASDRDGNREIYVMGAGENDLVNLTQHKAPDWQPAWSPDGKRVAFASYRDDNWQVYLVDVDGSNLIRLTEHEANDFSPTWSPDGNKILFVSRRRGDADLFVIDLNTLKLTQLTHSEMDEYDPAWSPDGQWIAFVTQIEGQADVFVMRADGSNPVNLTKSPYANDFQPVWTQYSESLIFASYTTDDGDHDLFRMRRDGRERTRITDDHVDDLAPCWRSLP